MTGIFVSRAPAGRPRCARCHRPFTPKNPDDRYGQKCARKLAGQIQLDSQVLISGKVLRKRNTQDEPIIIRDIDGEVREVIA